MFRLKKCLVIGQPLVRDKCLLGLSSPVISDQQKRCFNRAFLIAHYNQKKDFLKSKRSHPFTFFSQVLHSYFIFKLHLNSAFSCPRFVLVSFNVICFSFRIFQRFTFCFFSGKKLPPDVDPLGVFANDEIDLVIFKLPDIF